MDISLSLGWFLSKDEYLLVHELILVIRGLDLCLNGILDLSLGLSFLVPVLVEYGRWETSWQLERERDAVISWHQIATLEEENRSLVFNDLSVRFLLLSHSSS